MEPNIQPSTNNINKLTKKTGKKIVYIVGGLYLRNGMGSILMQKINWLVQNTEYKIHIVLTERPDLPYVYDVPESVEVVNFNLGFDELDTIPLAKKIFKYRKKVALYHRMLTSYLMEVRPDITVSVLRREINFINTIKDGSCKVGEFHFCKQFYRQFSKPYLPVFVNRLITKWWMNSLMGNIKKLDKFVVLTFEDAREWGSLKNMKVIPNFVADIPHGLSDRNSKQVIAVGRYTEQKGFDMLIEAWSKVSSRYHDWKLNIYGAGNKEPFEALAREKCKEGTIECHGAVSNIGDKFKESSFFVLSSRYEGFGMVIIEAMSYGLGTVSFACPCGPRDIISEGVDGVLVEPNNVDELANSIIRLIEDKQLRDMMAVSSSAKAKKFTAEKIMPEWVELFDSLGEKD